MSHLPADPVACRWPMLGSWPWNIAGRFGGRRVDRRPTRQTLEARVFLLPVGAVQTRGGGDLRSYEVMFIVPPEADESVVGGVIDRIAKIVSQVGGEVGKVDRWGRRRLAYEIARQSEGYYVVVAFTAEPSVIAELERSLHLADEVLRFKVVQRAA